MSGSDRILTNGPSANRNPTDYEQWLIKGIAEARNIDTQAAGWEIKLLYSLIPDLELNPLEEPIPFNGSEYFGWKMEKIFRPLREMIPRASDVPIKRQRGRPKRSGVKWPPQKKIDMALTSNWCQENRERDGKKGRIQSDRDLAIFMCEHPNKYRPTVSIDHITNLISEGRRLLKDGKVNLT